MAPEWLLDDLDAMADADGLLPGWTSWWSEAEVNGLFPGPTWRAAVEAAQPRLPLAYFRERVDVTATSVPSAYLAFGETYAEELARAEKRGWPVSVVPGGHLHLLQDPPAVAAELLGLRARVG